MRYIFASVQAMRPEKCSFCTFGQILGKKCFPLTAPWALTYLRNNPADGRIFMCLKNIQVENVYGRISPVTIVTLFDLQTKHNSNKACYEDAKYPIGFILT